ncbi:MULTISPECIES: IS110 family transposase [unclassified Bacteroides]|uniref:IS110 family transposase n=1 Tax=unclassified Bacteroides TaxID=2646097 RepID=UPI004062FA2E
MLINTYVGIDVSKLTLDVFIRESKLHKQVKNNLSGFNSLLKWLETTLQSLDTVLVCFEHTGLYSLPLALFLEERNMHYSMISPLEIKRSMGITRGKNDLIDSKRIAEFAFRFKDKVSETKLPAKDIRKVHSLLTLRDKLVTNMKGYAMTYNETLRTMRKEDFPELFSTYENMVASLKAEIKKVENAIKTILKNNLQLWTSYKLVTSVKGIGFIVASYLIVYTYNFTRFDTWRKFACYSGIAPFDYQSGTSVRGKTQVSSIANKQIKTMLHLASICAIHTDAELREYYHRRQTEGKTKMAVINIIRNKLVSRVFAVIKRGTPFVDIKKYAMS